MSHYAVIFANYFFILLYAPAVQDGLVRLVMVNTYSIVFVEQAVLVFLIERAVLRKSRSR